MPWTLTRFQNNGHLHFITFSCFRRKPLLSQDSVRTIFLKELERLRKKYHFEIAGYVLMPEHVHLLISEAQEAKLSIVLQVLKQNVSRRSKSPDGSQFWQERYYDFNVISEKKRVEKLRYIHRNPVARGLVLRPEDWEWSSYRAYDTQVQGIVRLSLPESFLAIASVRADP